MDGNNRRRGGQMLIGVGAVDQSAFSSSSSASPVDPDDWKAQLPLDTRHRTVNEIKEILKKRLPFSGQEQEGLKEINKIVVGFEEKISQIYSAAASQSDYLREISLKMRIMDTKSQSPTANSLQTNDDNASKNCSVLGKRRIRNESAIGFLDGNNWRGAQVSMVQPQGGQTQGGAVEKSALSSTGGAPPMKSYDWSAQLPLVSRHSIVNKIMETLKKQLPFCGQEELQEIKKIAVGFEEKVYSAASSQPDYIRKISLTMLAMEENYQSPTANSLQTNASRNPSDLDETRNTGAGDWQEEVYQKIKSMKDIYFCDMYLMYMEIVTKLQQLETRPLQQPPKFEKLKFFKPLLECLLQFLRLSKNDIQISHKDTVVTVEKHIMRLLLRNEPQPRSECVFEEFVIPPKVPLALLQSSAQRLATTTNF